MGCSIEGCDGRVFAAGMCSRHYNRLRTTGSVEDGPRARGSLPDRFWRQVDRRGKEECWPWLGKSQVKGYGTIGLGGRSGGKMLAHRVAWVLSQGDIPDAEGHHGLVVRHSCDNPLCCNPAHLEIGSQADNVRDMDRRGRRISNAKAGSTHHNSVLTEKDVRAIRASRESDVELASRYGVHRKHIAGIRKRRSWTHI